MNVKFLNPFVEAAYQVLQAETRLTVTRGELNLDKEPYLTDDITVIISLVGQVMGNVIYSLNNQTAIALASRMMEENLNSLSALAQSSIAELANVITGRASVLLAQAGFESVISPPTFIMGKGAIISTLDFARLVVPLNTEAGSLIIHLALREGSQKVISAGNVVAANRFTL
ncbi:MAG: chemotaxis protein CheX [Chloroflexota bacterium]